MLESDILYETGNGKLHLIISWHESVRDVQHLTGKEVPFPGYPLHRKNRGNGQKKSLSGKTQ